MRISDLRAGLYAGQTLRIEKDEVCVLDTNGEVLATYTMGPRGEMWLGRKNITSEPPPGFCKIVNQYWDPKIEHVVVIIDNKPV